MKGVKDVLFMKGVKDVKTVCTSSTIAKMYSHITNSKKLTVHSFYNGKS